MKSEQNTRTKLVHCGADSLVAAFVAHGLCKIKANGGRFSISHDVTSNAVDIIVTGMQNKLLEFGAMFDAALKGMVQYAVFDNEDPNTPAYFRLAIKKLNAEELCVLMEYVATDVGYENHIHTDSIKQDAVCA